MSTYIPKAIPVDARQFTRLNGPLLGKWFREEGWNAYFFTPSPTAAIGLATTLTIWEPYPNNDSKKILREGDWIVKVGRQFYIYDYDTFMDRFEKGNA